VGLGNFVKKSIVITKNEVEKRVKLTLLYLPTKFHLLYTPSGCIDNKYSANEGGTS